MKTYLTKAVTFVMVLSTCLSCTVESAEDSNFNLNSEEISVEASAMNEPCNGDNPKARLTNNGTTNFDLEIYTIDGILLNHEYNVAPGSSTSWLYFVPGETIFSVTSTTVEDSKVHFPMGTCMEFEMEIGEDNLLTDSVPQ